MRPLGSSRPVRCTFPENGVSSKFRRPTSGKIELGQNPTLEELEAESLRLGVWIADSKFRVHTPRWIVSRMNFYGKRGQLLNGFIEPLYKAVF